VTSTVRVDHDGPVASLILDRPARYNAMSPAMSRDMAGALADLAASDARVLVVRGEGDAFSAGADLRSLDDDLDLDDADAIRDYVLGWSHNIVALRALPIPSIAAVRGPAYGGGFSLAIACDVVIASRTARFNTQYVNIGINPDLGASWTLPRVVTPAIARYLMLRGNEVGGDEAHRIGLVAEVVEDDRTIARAYELAREIAGRSAQSIRSIRALLDGASTNDLVTSIRHEADAIATAFLTPQFRAALAEFKQKREGATR
jgi:2-(1,2-epoxy-1,2-dihydrophenyl)acetyl-CoA isomerase